jgi:hypothetical protein
MALQRSEDLSLALIGGGDGASFEECCFIRERDANELVDGGVGCEDGVLDPIVFLVDH